MSHHVKLFMHDIVFLSWVLVTQQVFLPCQQDAGRGGKQTWCKQKQLPGQRLLEQSCHLYMHANSKDILHTASERKLNSHVCMCRSLTLIRALSKSGLKDLQRWH